MDPNTNPTGSAATPAEEPNYLDMPDDEVMSLSAPPVSGTPAQDEPDPDDQEQDPTPPSPEDGAGNEPDAGQANDPDEAGQNGGGEAADGTGEGEEGGDGADKGGAAAKPSEGKQTPDPAQGQAPAAKKDEPASEQAKPQAAPAKALTDYTAEEKAAAFDQVMAPFKANDRMIELRSPEEAVKLMQMGANYTKKMQALQPQLRVVKMLENNGLLDENKLAFAIDLMAGKPLAIQKLLADAQFDPMGVDKDQAADYKPGNHQVSDSEMAFQSALDELETSDSGKELIAEVATQWDAESKQVLFQHPEVLQTLHQQKDLGLYQQITSEMARLQALGQIPQGTPFLQAYRAIGDMLHQEGRLRGPQAPQAAQVTPPQGQEPPQPVEVRVATPPSQVANTERARAAAPTKSVPSSAKQEENYLAMTDEDFLKQMEGRL